MISTLVVVSRSISSTASCTRLSTSDGAIEQARGGTQVFPLNPDHPADLEPLVAALEQGKVDLLVNYDPAATLIAERKVGKILIDARSDAGARQVYGGLYPTSVLYAQSAFLQQRPVPILDDVAAVMPAALGHRLQLTYAARADGLTPDALIAVARAML